MADTSIEWSDKVWNPVTGCTRVSAGCDHCYAVGMTARLDGLSRSAAGDAALRDKLKRKYAGLTVLNPKGDRHFNGKVRTHEDELGLPLTWKTPAKIFVNSMSDLFHRDVPFEFIDKVFAVMALCPQHIFQVLTKRPARMAEYLNHRVPDVEPDRFEPASSHQRVWKLATDQSGAHCYGQVWPLPNVWLGTSVEDQPAADKRIPDLLRCPAAVRFLSCEPLLGPVDLEAVSYTVSPGYFGDALQAYHWPGTPEEIAKLPPYPSVDWVIVGGESGHGARAVHPDWVRSLRDQCAAASTDFFFKQWGEWKPLSTVDGRQSLPFGEYVLPTADSKGFGFKRVGKKSAGRLLDGVEHNAMPATAVEVAR